MSALLSECTVKENVSILLLSEGYSNCFFQIHPVYPKQLFLLLHRLNVYGNGCQNANLGNPERIDIEF